MLSSSSAMPFEKGKVILLATMNRAKQQWLAWLLEGSGLTWVTPE